MIQLKNRYMQTEVIFVYFVALMSLMTQYTVSSTECDLNVKALATDLEDCDILDKLAKFNGDLFAQDAVYHKEWMNEYYTRHRSQLQKKMYGESKISQS